MNIIKAHNLACPMDGKKLEQRDRQFFCENGHTFDIARQGYVNLLPVQLKRSKQPGDSKNMVLARTQFLDSGIYQVVANKLSDIVIALLAEIREPLIKSWMNSLSPDFPIAALVSTCNSPAHKHISTALENSESQSASPRLNQRLPGEICLLDAGCGEGYYFDYLFNKLSDIKKSNHLSFIGLDISKDAIIQATKRNKQISWVVATNRQPPVEDKSVDIILCLFGFMSLDAFSKILKPDGKIIIVDPGPDHLKELREIIYPKVKEPKKENSIPAEHSGFTLVERKSLQFKRKITEKKQVNNLLLMTPHFYRASKEGRETACQLNELDITVDVVFSVLKKM